MGHLQDFLSRLPEAHRLALRWFNDRAGADEPVSIDGLHGRIPLAGGARG
jgi:hypothetical protein